MSIPLGNLYLNALLKDLVEHPLDVELRRMIADTYELELDDTFTADLWRYHADVLEGKIEFYLIPDHAQRVRDIVVPDRTTMRRDTHTRVRVMQYAPPDYKKKTPEMT